MPTETIRPTAHVVTNPTVNNPAQGYNGNTADYAVLTEGTVGGIAAMTANGLPADTSPASRTLVTLNVPGSWKSGDTVYDNIKIYARKISTDAWTEVLSDMAGGAWASQPSQTNRTADLTSLMGTQPSTDWEFAVQFFNGGAGSPTPPIFTS